jgi:hypothetical protein
MLRRSRPARPDDERSGRKSGGRFTPTHDRAVKSHHSSKKSRQNYPVLSRDPALPDFMDTLSSTFYSGAVKKSIQVSAQNESPA